MKANLRDCVIPAAAKDVMSAEVLSSGREACPATDFVYDVRKCIPHDMVARGSQHAGRLLMIGSLGRCTIYTECMPAEPLPPRACTSAGLVWILAWQVPDEVE